MARLQKWQREGEGAPIPVALSTMGRPPSDLSIHDVIEITPDHRSFHPRLCWPLPWQRRDRESAWQDWNARCRRNGQLAFPSAAQLGVMRAAVSNMRPSKQSSTHLPLRTPPSPRPQGHANQVSPWPADARIPLDRFCHSPLAHGVCRGAGVPAAPAQHPKVMRAGCRCGLESGHPAASGSGSETQQARSVWVVGSVPMLR